MLTQLYKAREREREFLSEADSLTFLQHLNYISLKRFKQNMPEIVS